MNDAPQGPKNCMNTAVARKREMAWMKRIGVKGIAWFAGSSILAAACGVAAATFFEPGAGLAGTALVQEAVVASRQCQARDQRHAYEYLFHNQSLLFWLIL